MKKMLALCLAALLALTMLPGSAMAAYIRPLADGNYYVESKINGGGFVLDCEGASQDDCARILLWDFTGAENQVVNVLYLGGGKYRLTFLHSGKAFDVEGGSTGVARVIQFGVHNGENQGFSITKEEDCWYSITAFSGLKLDVSGGQIHEQLQTYPSNGTDAQRFRFVPLNRGAQHTRPLLRAGCTGEDVVYLQACLDQLHYSIEMDGIFGEDTRAAVCRMQADSGLVVDGVVGEKTWDALIQRLNGTWQRNGGAAAQPAQPVSEGTESRLAFSAPNLESVRGCKQFKDMCTSCATVALLPRREYVDGKELTFNFGDVRMSLGAKRGDLDRGIYKSLTFYAARTWTDSYTVTNGGNTSYTTRLISGSAGTKDKVLELLRTHPEGVVIYKNYGPSSHAITITDYSGGRFYAIDPVTNNGVYASRAALEDTCLYGKCGGVDQVFYNAAIWYIP